MPLAGTRRRTPNLATAEEIAAEYRNGPLRVPKAQAAQALHAAVDALRLPNRARLLIRVLLDASPTADWTRSGGLIGVWPSIETLKRKTGLSKAALGRAQADLREAGLVAFRDSGNYKRWGTRDDSGALLDFRGFDLSPIAARHGELVEFAAVAALERRRWSAARAIVTERRRAILAAIIEASENALPGPWDELQGRYDALEDRFGRVLRNPGTTPIDDVELLEECAAALAGLDADVCRLLSAPAASVCETAGNSGSSDRAEVSTTPLDFEPHIESTTKEAPVPLYERGQAAEAAQHPREAASGRQSALRREPGAGGEVSQGSAAPSPKRTQVEIRVPIALVQRALPVLADHGASFTSWSQLVRLAHERFSQWTGGSAQLWREGQTILGSNGAAVAFGIALQKHALGETDRPGAYFAGIVEAARVGRRCDLNASVRGLAERAHAPVDILDCTKSRRRSGPPLPLTEQKPYPPLRNGKAWRPRS
jgi:replication initiation protein RepC